MSTLSTSTVHSISASMASHSHAPKGQIEIKGGGNTMGTIHGKANIVAEVPITDRASVTANITRQGQLWGPYHRDTYTGGFKWRF